MRAVAVAVLIMSTAVSPVMADSLSSQYRLPTTVVGTQPNDSWGLCFPGTTFGINCSRYYYFLEVMNTQDYVVHEDAWASCPNLEGMGCELWATDDFSRVDLMAPNDVDRDWVLDQLGWSGVTKGLNAVVTCGFDPRDDFKYIVAKLMSTEKIYELTLHEENSDAIIRKSSGYDAQLYNGWQCNVQPEAPVPAKNPDTLRAESVVNK